MTRAELNKYIGKKVRITFYDYQIISGILTTSDIENKKYTYMVYPNGFYKIDNVYFKVSYIRKCEEIR